MEASSKFYQVKVADIIDACIQLAKKFQAADHRAELTIALAARANATLNQRTRADIEDLRCIAPMVLQHRRTNVQQSEQLR